MIDAHVFIMEEKALLDRFAAEWAAKSKKQPELYPGKMDRGDWFDQLIFWINGLHESRLAIMVQEKPDEAK